jgi:hypothetical protein
MPPLHDKKAQVARAGMGAGARTCHGVVGQEVLPGIAGPAAGVAGGRVAAAPVVEAVHACAGRQIRSPRSLSFVSPQTRPDRRKKCSQTTTKVPCGCSSISAGPRGC